MTVSADETTRALRRTVYPFLKAAGFDDWTTRNAWRRNGARIEHIEFASFNTYRAEQYACTHASLSVWIGCQIPELSIKFKPTSGPKGLRPLHSGMAIRSELAPSLGLKQRNPLKIWRIETVEDAQACASDILVQLESYGLNWINKTYDADDLLRHLLNNPAKELQTRPNGARLWLEVGNLDSPNRNWMIAELAKANGDFATASDRFERSRWALNHQTGEHFLFRSTEEDAELCRLASECAEQI